MPFAKGQSGNPGGRARRQWRDNFEAAVAAVEKQEGVNLFEHFVRTALVDNTVLVALMRKRVPDLQSIATQITGGSPFSLIIGISPQVLPGNVPVPSDTKKLGQPAQAVPINATIRDVIRPNKTQAKVKNLRGKVTPKAKRKRPARPKTNKRRAKRAK